MTSVIILGSTGSVGTQTLEVISAFNRVALPKERIKVVGLAAKHDSELLKTQAERFQVKKVVVYERDGREVLLELAKSKATFVVNAIGGYFGLFPSLAALSSKSTLLLANKETLVSGGPLLDRYLKQIIPLDSEHSSIWQILRNEDPADVRRVIITASGGPFFGKHIGQLFNASLEDALKHPTWSMGQVITINSATLVNKALELAEACALFRLPADKIEIKVERTSQVHAIVEFVDGSTSVQIAPPDMRIPISVALGVHRRIPNEIESVDLTDVQKLAFLNVDNQAFPAISLMRKCLAQGPLFATVYNAANEILVEKFIQNEIGFLDIVSGIDQVVGQFTNTKSKLTLEDVKSADQWARERADEIKLDLFDVINAF
ncbi:MAG: 1-deoxy-D-xylulose-5-phosphate reductoisomerase [Bifidobacteriaceae bacterium]|jgi:1-deoxy-D-xylulose-5-phosphate reductoisomerase|nr:1-deoxy-D-xylulose-5-phosphate reductoisomerase [Bifidobacteriaceae bacterium]